MAEEPKRGGFINNDIENDSRDSEPNSGPAGATRKKNQSRGPQGQSGSRGIRQQKQDGGNADGSDIPGVGTAGPDEGGQQR